MVEIKIKEERALNLVEIDDILDDVKKRDGELNSRSEKVREYVKQFAKAKLKDVKELKKKLIELNIPRLRDKQVTKLVDMMPNDAEGVRAVLNGDNIVVKPEDVDKIVALLKE